MPENALPTPLRWDIFCRVIDNFGDIGVCWRLAADLAARGQTLRLWVDDARALAWMAPQGAPGVSVHPWPASDAPNAATFAWPEPGDVVLETFGCELPPAFIARMAAAGAQRGRAPVWLNLEYLSAESYVERSHRLASPQWHAPANGLMKWFFYPGFTPATGGLLREAHLPAPPLSQPERHATLAELGGPQAVPQPGERCISVFCYPHAPLAELLARLADRPSLLLAAPGAVATQLASLPLPAGVRLHTLPWLSQTNFDRLLAACDVNLVRGEDSFVRAQWAGQPFLWHIYEQEDGVHAEKLNAFLERHLQHAAPELAASVRCWMRWWNGLDPASPATNADRRLPAWPDAQKWGAHCLHWRQSLLTQADLSAQLLKFVTEKY